MALVVRINLFYSGMPLVRKKHQKADREYSGAIGILLLATGAQRNEIQGMEILTT